METIFYQYNPWWEGKFQPSLFPRKSIENQLKDQLDNRPVIFLSGLRRVGKTSLMKLLIKYLIDKKGVNPKTIFYVSLDNYLLSKSNIIDIINEYRKIQNLKQSDFVYLFLDEITCKEDFEIQLKNLYDIGNAKVFASSSSASLIRSKKNHLTGRNLIFEVLPLDFEEYLDFKQIKLLKADTHLKEKYFDDFLFHGGIPEYVITGDNSYLSELVDDIIHKDIAALHNIKNIGILKDYFLLLMERSGKTISINKVANILQISPDTARRYLDIFSDTFLIHTITRFGKTNERLLSAKKIYVADIGIRNLFTGFRDRGSLFENYVFLKIKHLYPHYVYEKSIEIDFITANKHLVEVKYHDEDLSPKQQFLFDSVSAKTKTIIRNNTDIMNFLKKTTILKSIS